MSSPLSRQIRVLVVDDDPLVRSALGLMLGGLPDLVLVGEARDGAEALVIAERERPEVVLMDIRMPVMNGLDATRAMLLLPRAPSVIVMTTFNADEYVVEAVAAGADGFLVKDTPAQEIVSAIRRVADGEAMLSPSVTRAVLEQMRQTSLPDRSALAEKRLASLTQREREVAICVGRGLSNADIAGELYLSVPTVKAHVSRLFDKLDSTNRVQIAMVVHDAGLV
jgi:DNA-binding NarL/FixJ family response regulator